MEMRNRLSRRPRAWPYLSVLMPLVFALIFGLTQFAVAQDAMEFTIWDYNGDGLSPADTGQDLCAHGYAVNVTGTRDISIPEATSIEAIDFEIFTTNCGEIGNWQFFLNGTLIGVVADPGFDCTCSPAASKWPLSISFSDSAALTALWIFGGSNQLRVVPGGTHMSYYGATIEYQTTLHPVITPAVQSAAVGDLVTFDASGSYSDVGTIVSYEWDFGDGETSTGVSASHVYDAQGAYTVTLAIEDDGGQIASARASVDVHGPPEVATVPWRLGFPHLTWNGNPAVLKGVVKDLDLPLTYIWDFGDGASVSGTITTEDQKYEVEATHVYPSSPDGTPFLATLTVTDPSGLTGSDQYRVLVKDRTLEVETDVAIDDGMWWLHKQIERYEESDVAAGRWTEGGFTVAPTAAAVLAFEVQGHRAVGDSGDDPYIETVRRGLNHLFTQMQSRGIGMQTYGNPDTNGNGLGVDTVGSRHTYEIGMALMALAGSGAPDWVAETGPSGVIGRTYFDIATDMVDMCSWGQNEYGYARGGWRYDWNQTSSDNSISQWPVIGLEAAEANWDIAAPDFVKRELEIWLDYSQNSAGAWGYTGPDFSYSLPAKTGAGIAGLSYLGYESTDSRIQDGLSYLNGHWTEYGYYGIWYNNYSMYAIMKGMRTAHPGIEMVGTHDWYAEFASHLVGLQSSDGSWYQGNWTSGRLLDTAWSVLILTPTVVAPPPVADLQASPLQARPGAVFTFDATGSYHLDPDRTIVQYDFDFGDGTTVTSFDGVVTHVYMDTVDDLAGMPGQRREYVVTVTVTDDDPEGAKSDTDTESITLSLDNNPPVADTGGPYTGYEGVPLSVSAADSYDPDQGPPLYNHIVSYEWELDAVAPYGFDDADTVVTSWTWPVVGTYDVGLKVTDRFGETNTAWTTVEILPGVPTEVFIRDRHVNYSDTVDLQARLLTTAGDPVSGMTLDFYVDEDNDGSFDPVTEYVGSATTDADGWVTAPYTAWIPPETYPIKAEFTGVDPYFASFNSSTLRVDPEPTILTYTGDLQGHNGEAANLSALLTDDEGDPLAGMQVTFTLGSQGGAALTGGDGIGTAALVLSQCVGAYSVDTAFDGDAYYLPSTGSGSFELLNTAPSVVPGPDQTTDEGTLVGVSATFSDPDPCQTHGSNIEWGDGDTVPGTLGAGTVTGSHVYADDGDHTVMICVSDSAGGATCAQLMVAVNNVAPAVGAITAPLDPVEVNTPITANAPFTDPGSADTHVASWDWGDGSADTGLVVSPALGTHTYAEAGVYTVTLTVTDDDGGIGQSTFQYVVVFDPSAGFVTGGGWVDSPAGAYLRDPELTGKATFGFVSKYKKGTIVPIGNTEFQFHAADLNFHSSEYEWLVVTGGDYARFKGVGTINGDGEYKFMIWAGDDDPDTFRVKIWQEDDDGNEIVEYDNLMDQAIEGGSIVVHTKD